MPIIQISRIQHRRGLREDLPNLASAELGWCIDTRQLFIGNGTLAEGAPTLGRTEVLTEYSDLFGKFGGYTYSGEEATGYAATTGPSAVNPVQRSLQSRLDDVVSVKSFGALGDGVTDDTAAINRALYQLYCREPIPAARKTLYFPAGLYIISDTIKIPTYALLAGDGKNSTIIKMTSNPNSVSNVVSLADSQQQVGLNIGNNSALTPSNIDIYNMTFETIEDISLLSIEQAHHCSFYNVGFYGAVTDPNSLGNLTKGFTASSTPVLQTYAIVFDKCSFGKTTYAVVLDDDVQNIIFNACDFSEHFIGFKIGEDTGSDPLIEFGPRSIRVTNSLFKDIASNGIIVYSPVHGFSSAFNFFQEVGNQYAGNGNPDAPVIVFQSTDNTSFGDYFERTDADDKLIPRVQNSQAPTLVQYPTELRMGSLRQSFGGELELSANGYATSTGITFDYTQSQAYIMDYSIEFDGNYRNGTMKIAGLDIDEEYAETATINFNFYLAREGNIATLLYDGYAYGENTPKMKYAVRYFGLPPSIDSSGTPICTSNYIRITLSGPYWGTNSGFIGFTIRNSNGDVTTTESAYNAYIDGPRTPSLFGDIEGIWGDNESIDILETYTFALSDTLTYNDIATIEFEWMNPYEGFDVSVELGPNANEWTTAGFGRVLAFEEPGDPAFPITCAGIVPT